MAVRVSVDLPDGAFSTLRLSPDEFVPKLLLAATAKWYELGRISQAKAAEIAGVSREEFLAALHEFGVSPFQVTPGEAAAEGAP
ncbi:MAG: UPF0175 family protein [Planctomycetes bacterium]|nr:UPF0175 family protein [Planctomycetota bacterium]